MDLHHVKIKSIRHINHDVLEIVTGKPGQFNYMPGQATEISIGKQGWENEKRPFTFTSLPGNDYLEFNIKTYPARCGVTNELLQLETGDELILHEVFGDIRYKGEGVFIAGGAGITPFISILRDLRSKNEIGNNRLIFANKTKADIIHEEEFRNLLGDNFINILSDEKAEGYAEGRITEDFIRANMGAGDKYFYLCGPPPMMEAIEKQLAGLDIDEKFVVKEAF